MILVVVLTDAAAASCAGGGRELVLTEPPAEAAVTGETAGDEEPAEEEPSSEESEEAAAAERPATIWVHVCGAVKREGVYELPEGSRVFEALRLAGGCTAEADTSYCNQAAVLSDAQKVYIPTKEEAEKLRASEAVPQEAGTPETGAGSSGTAGGKININTADAALLTQIPGVGESKAKSIIAYRDEHGPFKSTEDLMKVSGIAAASFEKMRDYITAE
ncbi:MAG: helix-hairpin-helix domain-containing protein [Lachnospiraceae bacterium]|nr:helix-hairpin-helix domain-containing protein [Lachnospiraceae bacterium]